jgi:hypothetical protein
MKNSVRFVATIGAAAVVAVVTFGCAGTHSSTAQNTSAPASPYNDGSATTTHGTTIENSTAQTAASNSGTTSGYTGPASSSYTVADNSRPMDQERAPRPDRN